MGTGITSILLHNLPYNARWLQTLGTIIFVLNVVVFVLLCLGNMARYVRYKGVFSAVGKHTLAGLFWGCLPMGLATIVVSSFVTHHCDSI
jgi:tellurite resistance protein TehA-like permease